MKKIHDVINKFTIEKIVNNNSESKTIIIVLVVFAIFFFLFWLKFDRHTIDYSDYLELINE